MKYNYTAYYDTKEKRINAIAEDILSEYPRLGKLAIEAAEMEKPFGRVNADYDLFSDQENRINRLIDIVIVTEGKPQYQEEYLKACKDLIQNYESWKKCFTYANREEQAAYMVIKRFIEHEKDKSKPLMTFKEAQEEQWKLRREQEMQEKSERLRTRYPMLGSEITNKVIEDEYHSGIWLRFQEMDIIRLVSIIKLIEGNEKYTEAYKEYLKELKKMYEKWQKYENFYMNDDTKMVVEMMDRLNKHLADENVPIATFAEIKNELNDKGKKR